MSTEKKPRWAWHVHHDTLVEPVWEEEYGGLAGRRRYILKTKPPQEHALRLRLMKYVKGQLPPGMSMSGEKGLALASLRAQRAMKRLHKKECPRCPWDGHTIFPGGWALP